MSQNSNGGFVWSGSLQSTNIRMLYERCQRLRITGLMRLQQGEAVLDLMWMGGEPIESEGDQGTRSLPLWSNGEFTVEQRMPDFKGQLISGIEMNGALRAGQAQAIYKLCADNVLSADVALLRGNGETAQVRFTLGKAETASINGQNESALSALSKLSSWIDGTFRVGLRPLFGENAAAEAPVFSEKKASNDEKFDVTGSVNIDPSKGPVQWPAELAELAGVGAPVPMDTGSGNHAAVKREPVAAPAPAAAPAAIPAAAPAPAPLPIPPRLHATLMSSSPPAGLMLPKPTASSAAAAALSSAPTVPMTSIPRAQIAQLMKPTAEIKSEGNIWKTMSIVIGLLIVVCSAVIFGFFFLRKH